MAYKTLAALTTEVEQALYQVAGPTVQIYSEAILQQMVQDAFDHVFLKRFWHRFCTREQRTLDGTTGQPTLALTNIKFYEDIQYVFRDGSKRPLPVLPSTYNSLNMQGTTPRFVEAAANTKLITCYPLTSVGDVLISGRRRPTAYASGDIVEFDSTCLKHYTVFSYFVDDGSNPAAASKHQALFETRLKELEMADQQFNTPLDNFSTEIPEQWYDAGPTWA